MKLDFKKYYESKKKLLEAIDSSPRIRLKYKLNKYCKVPLQESIDSTQKTYVSFKPDDIIEILWEYDTPDNPTVKYIKLLTENVSTFFPVWNSSKMFKWTLNNTEEL